ncbi:MAG: hypothetical protein AAF549_05590 [Pseudomonadota bacterium]
MKRRDVLKTAGVAAALAGAPSLLSAAISELTTIGPKARIWLDCRCYDDTLLLFESSCPTSMDATKIDLDSIFETKAGTYGAEEVDCIAFPYPYGEDPHCPQRAAFYVQKGTNGIETIADLRRHIIGLTHG